MEQIIDIKKATKDEILKAYQAEMDNLVGRKNAQEVRREIAEKQMEEIARELAGAIGVDAVYREKVTGYRAFHDNPNQTERDVPKNPMYLLGMLISERNLYRERCKRAERSVSLEDKAEALKNIDLYALQDAIDQIKKAVE